MLKREFHRSWKKLQERLRIQPEIRLDPRPSPATKFSQHVETNRITLPRLPIFSAEDVFFTMGSCFAEEIRIALTARGVACVPHYRQIAFDDTQALVDELPGREHMNFYNTFTVLSQIEEILGLWTQAPDDHWTIRKKQDPPKWGAAAFQDPYRRLVLGRSPEALNQVLAEIRRVMTEGFFQASAFIFTFGMTEVFLNEKTGRVTAQKPLYKGAGGDTQTRLHVSTFAENYRNVSRIVSLIRQHRGEVPIILTVSPVPLQRTFQEADVVTVNAESKAILRAVLGQVCREATNVHYLPSYELVTLQGATGFEPDRRHVRRPVVDGIVQAFCEAWFK